MPLDTQQANALATGFTTLARQFQFPGVDAQRLAMAFRMILDAHPGTGPIDVQPLCEYLISELRVPAGHVLDFCVILKSRQDHFGVQFQFPPQLDEVDSDRSDRVLQAFFARTGAAWEKKAPVEEAKVPAKGERGWEPVKSKKGAPQSKTRRYVAALVVTVVAGGGFLGWLIATKEPPIVEIPADSAPGLACTKLFTNGTGAICEIPLAMWTAGPEETLRAKAKLTRTALLPRGVTSLFVRAVQPGGSEGKLVLVVQ